jgi:PhoH-like ATPase
VSKKTFVLDTNVLIHDPQSILKFEENDIVIPVSVLEELDELKKGQGEIPYSARHALKLLDSLRANGNAESTGQSLSKGVSIPNGKGGRLRVELNEPLSHRRILHSEPQC